MFNLLRHRRGRRNAALLILLSLVWLGVFSAPVAGRWGLPVNPYHAGGRLGVNTDLLSRSGLSAWAIDRYLAANTPLPKLGSAFLKAERRYGVNARYLIAHAMLESGFGTSDIARYAHNLFGYHAYDRDPWRYATRFKSYAAGIDAVTAAIKADYLVPSGRFWGGAPTLRGMFYYASDPNWAIKIRAIADGLDLPTLSRLGVRFGSLDADTTLAAGSHIFLRLAYDPGRSGGLPSGLRFVVRFRPIALREGDPQMALVGRLPRGLLAPGFVAPSSVSVTTHVVTLVVVAPSWPGRYSIDAVVLDSDGSALPDARRLRIASTTARVVSALALTYRAQNTQDGIRFSVTNTGSNPLAVGGLDRRDPDHDRSTVEAWVLPLAGGAPHLLARAALADDLRPTETVNLDIDAARLGSVAPAVVLVRLRPAGQGSVPSGTPAVYRVDTASGQPVGLDESLDGPLRVTEIVPTDPTSARLLRQVRGLAVTAALPKARPTHSSSTVPPSPQPTIVVQLHLPLRHTAVPAATGRSGPADGSLATTPVSTSLLARNDAAARLDESASHATMTLDALPVANVDQGLSLRLPITLPKGAKPWTSASGLVPITGTNSGPASYLAVSRVLLTVGGLTVATDPQVFWLIVPGQPGSTAAAPAPPASHVSKPKPKPRPKPKPAPKARATASPHYRIHIVRAGETLWSISRRTGWAVEAIRRINPWVGRTGIHPGDAIRIPY